MKKSKMWSKFIFFIIIIIEAGASLPDNNDPMKIIFKIQTEPNNTLICDHSDDKKQQNIYTVLEGEPFTIVTKYENAINNFTCHAYTDEKDGFHYKKTNMTNETTFVVEKRMGTLWKCTILTHQDNPIKKPVVHYKGADYTAAYCFMKIHVRQIEPPQMMMVNNNKIPAARRDLSEKDVDFIAEYQYVDGDVVNVTCAKPWIEQRYEPLLTMEYEMAGTTSDESTMKDISSSVMIGFVTKLHSGHNNSYMICTNTNTITTDYTKVMMRFVMKTKRNIISITINGMIQRPILINATKNQYKIDYKFTYRGYGYYISQPINVMCEVEQTDVKLVVLDDDIAQSKNYKKTELIPNKKTEMRFQIIFREKKILSCSAVYVTGMAAESVDIHFTAADFAIDRYPSLHMELPSNSTVMELYSYGDYKLTVILYEFKHDETLHLTCGPLLHETRFHYLQLNNIETCRVVGCNVSKTLHVTHEHVYPPIVCYLKLIVNPFEPREMVLKEIRVILRERALTTESSTTEPATTTIIPARTAYIFTNNTAADPSSSSKTSEDSSYSTTLVYSLSAFGLVTMIIILVVLSYICIKKQCCVKPSAPIRIPAPSIDPASVFYENLLSTLTPINDREAAEAADQQENHYEEIH